MIGKLRGTVTDIFPDNIIVDVNGVGYKVEGIMGAKKDEEVVLYIYTHVREQELRLFGFKSKDVMIMFQKLLDVQGIGPKLAVKLVNQLDLNDIVMAIIQEDSNKLKVPGLGEKLAKKIIIDLKNKVTKENENVTFKVSNSSKEVVDILDALLSLGFRRDRIEKVLSKIALDGKDQQTIIKEALFLLNKEVI